MLKTQTTEKQWPKRQNVCKSMLRVIPEMDEFKLNLHWIEAIAIASFIQET